MLQMIIDEKSVAVDTDFISHVAEIRRPICDVAKIFSTILLSLSRNAIMHPLVFEHEIPPNDTRIHYFFDHNIIDQISFDDIFQHDPIRESYYKYLVPELYSALHGTSAFSPETDILSYWKRRESLGEIHTVAMCLVTSCGLFLSDDQDSKGLSQIVSHRAMGSIAVYNRKEFLDFARESSDVDLPKPDRKAFAHASG